jgi:hypothetical protein
MFLLLLPLAITGSVLIGAVAWLMLVMALDITRELSLMTPPNDHWPFSHGCQWRDTPIGGDLYEMCTLCHRKRYKDPKKQAKQEKKERRQK